MRSAMLKSPPHVEWRPSPWFAMRRLPTTTTGLPPRLPKMGCSPWPATLSHNMSSNDDARQCMAFEWVQFGEPTHMRTSMVRRPRSSGADRCLLPLAQAITGKMPQWSPRSIPQPALCHEGLRKRPWWSHTPCRTGPGCHPACWKINIKLHISWM